MSLSLITTTVVGIVLCVVYLRDLYAVLQKSARERFEPPPAEDDRFRRSLVGAIGALIASIVLTMCYGFSPEFLYVGPIVCLLIPVALIYCMREELKS